MTEIEEKLPADLLKEIYVNGVEGTSGDYSLPPLPPAALARVIKGESAPGNLRELKFKKGRPVDSPVAESVADPRDVAQAGWAVVFPAEMDPRRREAIKEALKPLLDHRREKAGDLFRIFEGENGCRAAESKQDFCKRQSPEIKSGPARPEQMPFYVLLVGSPEEIPYEFQFQLDVMRGVGRLDFGNHLEAYARYAQNVVAAEKGTVKLPRRAAFFSVRNPGDDATLISDRYLVQPLLANLQEPKLPGEIRLNFPWELIRAPSGMKAELARLLSGQDQTPALLFTASHGMVFSPPAPLQQQLREQGALLCQSWVRGRPTLREDYFAAEDLGNANLLGLVAMFFACFGAGTPKYDYFIHPNANTKLQIAPYNFVSALPKRMLAQGALAVIGHVDRAWGHSFISPGNNVEIGAFVTALRKMFNGDPVGLATDPSFNLKYADMTATLNDILQELRRTPTYLSDEELVRLWTANNDARSYVVLGDPAVRIPFATEQDTVVGRAAVPAPLPVTLVDKLTTLQEAIGPEPMADFAAPSPVAPVGDIKIDEAHKGLVNQDFAVQIDAVMGSLRNFAAKIATAIENVTRDVLTLEVRTYAVDNLKSVTAANAADHDLRALTRIEFDGDVWNYVPPQTTAVDAELLQIHREMVREAQVNRMQFMAAVAKMAGDLLDTLKRI